MAARERSVLVDAWPFSPPFLCEGERLLRNAFISPDQHPTSLTPAALRLVEPAPSDRWCVGKDVFSTGVVGAKASRVHVVSSKIGSHAAVPPSCALPFGAFERCVRLRANERVEPALRAAVGEVAQWGDRQGAPSEALARARAAVTQLMADDELRAEVERVAAEAGVAQGPTDWDALWDAIRGVWASQWGERAWLARRSAGIPEGKLRMSVLLQPVVPVAYSFVLHSADPLSGERGVVSGEVVAGLGEALVGNYPGRALRFKARAGEGAEVLSLPSKNVMVMAPEGHAIIAR